MTADRGGGGSVVVSNLSREYRRPRESVRRALDDVSLMVEPGEIHGLLGPNGAGKTTLCRILSTVLLPTGGQALVAGHDVVTHTAAVRRSIGIVFGGDRGLYNRLSARQNLMYWAALYRRPSSEAKQHVNALLDRVGLGDRADERVETFSRGMRQRLHLARGLIGQPRVVILDEPTVGMDPVAAHEFRVLVSEVRAEGRTVLLTTHDMAEAEAICDRVTMIDGGRLLATEDPRTIGHRLLAYERIVASGVPDATLAGLGRLTGVVSVEAVEPGVVHIGTQGEAATRAVLLQLVDAGVTTLSTGRPSLEEVYLHVIGERGMVI